MTTLYSEQNRFAKTGQPLVPTVLLIRLFLTGFLLAGFILTCTFSGVVQAQQLLTSDAPGRPLTDTELKDIDSHVWSDGTGLPAGQGSAAQGQPIYEQRCAQCHGGNGEGGTALELVGDNESLGTDFPDRGIAAMWPYAPSLFEYIRRSMPPEEPSSLSVEQTYAVLAHLLELNGLLQEGVVLDAAKLAAIKLPNRNGFIDIFSEP